MKHLLIPLVVGFVIGCSFKFMKLPVPVPHGLGGLLGLFGMFAGSEFVSYLANRPHG